MLHKNAPVLHGILNFIPMSEQIPEIDDVLDGWHSLRPIGIVLAELIQRFADPLEIQRS